MSSASSSMLRVGPAATASGGAAGTDGSGGATDSNNHLGSLRCTILSAYDVPLRDPPSYLEITAGGQTMRTGPPLQRHKDRNSFKFGTSNAATGSSSGSSLVVPAAGAAPSGNQQQPQQQGSSSSSSFAKNNTVCISAPLPVLYRDEVTIKVVYASNPRQNLITSYKLKQLPIRETTWLILTLTNQNMAEIADITNVTNGGKQQQHQHQQRPPADFGGGGDGGGGGGDASTTTSIPPPTLRLHMCLDGPYRAEIAALLQVARVWFGFVDSVEHYLTDVLWTHSFQPAADAILGVLPNVRMVDPKLLLVPAVPFAAAAVVCAPAIAGVLILSLPMLLPIVVVLGALLGAAATASACLYASTRDGRCRVGRALSPAVHTLLSTPAGQSAVYQTGNRPTPVGLARMLLPGSMWGKLWFSLWVDFMGSASYLLPVAGECADVIWAPVQTVLVAAMYDSVAPGLKYLSFAEEILPFTDIVPTATTGWLVEFALPMVKNQWSTASAGGGASSETTNNNGDKHSPGSAQQRPIMHTNRLS